MRLRVNFTHLTLVASFTQELSTENQRLVKELRLQQARYQDVLCKQQITRGGSSSSRKKTKARYGEGWELNVYGIPSRFLYTTDWGRGECCAITSLLHTSSRLLKVCPCGSKWRWRWKGDSYVNLHMCDARSIWWLPDMPFWGEITIQLVNQTGDHTHLEKTIFYHRCTPNETADRMTDKERSAGWGFLRFISNDNLWYNAARNTQYLMDNCLHIRVLNVNALYLYMHYTISVHHFRKYWIFYVYCMARKFNQSHDVMEDTVSPWSRSSGKFKLWEEHVQGQIPRPWRS